MLLKSISVFLVLSVIACSSKPQGQLTIKGQIKNIGAKSKIYFDELTYTNRTSLDSVSADAQGNFTIKTKLKNLGLYQIRVENKQAIFLVLDEHSSSVSVKADSSSIQDFTYELKGSPASDQLRKFITDMKKYGEAAGTAMNNYQTAMKDSISDSTRTALVAKVEEANNNFRTFAHSYIDTVKNPVIAIFVATNLDYQSERAEFDKLEQWVSKDYPNIAGKPVDYPYGPFNDAFTEQQHKYGPFEPIRLARSKKQAAK